MERAVFLDRDGVINHPVIRQGKAFAPTSFSEFRIYSGVSEALQRLHQAGFLLIVATNQPDVARGLILKEEVEKMHQSLRETFPLQDIKVCYETEESGNACYKPKPGMLFEAAHDFHIDLTQSYMVGDRWRDVGCGRAAGCFTIFIDRGYAERLLDTPDATCKELQDAVPIILRHAGT